jgi:hypothetical protein
MILPLTFLPLRIRSTRRTSKSISLCTSTASYGPIFESPYPTMLSSLRPDENSSREPLRWKITCDEAALSCRYPGGNTHLSRTPPPRRDSRLHTVATLARCRLHTDPTTPTIPIFATTAALRGIGQKIVEGNNKRADRPLAVLTLYRQKTSEPIEYLSSAGTSSERGPDTNNSLDPQ